MGEGTLLVVGVAATSLRARQRHGYGPCLVGLVATTALIIGKLSPTYESLVPLGLVVLAAALLWDGRPIMAGAPGGPTG